MFLLHKEIRFGDTDRAPNTSKNTDSQLGVAAKTVAHRPERKAGTNARDTTASDNIAVPRQGYHGRVFRTLCSSLEDTAPPALLL